MDLLYGPVCRIYYTCPEEIHPCNFGGYIGPNELHLFTENALEIMYQSEGVTNSPLHDISGKWSCIFSRTNEENRSRRKVFDRGLKSLNIYENRVENQVKGLHAVIEQYGDSPVPMDIVALQYAYDFMGQLVFAQSFNSLQDREVKEKVFAQRRALSILGRLAPVPWLIILALGLKRLIRGLPVIRDSPLEDWWGMEEAAKAYMEETLRSQDYDQNPDTVR